jgi:hypothetical protein
MSGGFEKARSLVWIGRDNRRLLTKLVCCDPPNSAELYVPALLLTLFSNDNSDRFFTVIKSWMD